eukprot:CAMPEP_0115038152 /NCGR_PEP_ID=MMETSP0216-20121206/43235_1 /TAXON_ID=223996 /ORGANISM="Protocruzia adherens, Strain Boccale" /LENGTH=56 /DNA_ID=CAMNT_0002418491 /DNA_START=27 /DNA_END=193 /DNA_ORIENTATION=+
MAAPNQNNPDHDPKMGNGNGEEAKSYFGNINDRNLQSVLLNQIMQTNTSTVAPQNG